MYKEKLYYIPAWEVDARVFLSQISRGRILVIEASYVIYIHTLFKWGMSIKDHFSWLEDSIWEIIFKVCQYRHAFITTDGVEIEIFSSLSNNIQDEVDNDENGYKHLYLVICNHLFIQQALEKETSPANDKKVKSG